MWCLTTTWASVFNTVANVKPNRVLEEQPPEINKEKLSLPHPQHAHSTLAQLRSGWRKNLMYSMYTTAPSKHSTTNPFSPPWFVPFLSYAIFY
ncbi:hypothetical protein M8J77_024224 [Diaphorina citri]|nr:hypothetical protein M8J77_024224 [Diaphorina citri]